jgi:hypothetical protein
MLTDFEWGGNKLEPTNTFNPIQKLSDFYGGNTSSYKSLKLKIKDTEYHTYENEWMNSMKASHNQNAFKITKRFSEKLTAWDAYTSHDSSRSRSRPYK